MFEWFTEFMESPLGKLISTGILAVAVLLLTLAAAGLVNRLMKKLVDRHRKTNSSIATVLGFVRYIAVAAVYFAGGMVIVGAIPVLSSAVRTLLATGGVIAVVAGLAAQEALGSVVSGVMILAFKPFKMGESCAMSIMTSPAALRRLRCTILRSARSRTSASSSQTAR